MLVLSDKTSQIPAYCGRKWDKVGYYGATYLLLDRDVKGLFLLIFGFLKGWPMCRKPFYQKGDLVFTHKTNFSGIRIKTECAGQGWWIKVGKGPMKAPRSK
ncbi:MAG: hypothetical protein CME17_09675 [Gemmatimonadetes bacterium]|nr:hypothetical protein [Gemmatimonadota bacterium]